MYMYRGMVTTQNLEFGQAREILVSILKFMQVPNWTKPSVWDQT